MMKVPEHVTFIIEAYYEAIKELVTALLLLDGYRCETHTCLFSYLEEHYPEFDTSEIKDMDNMRKIRNRIAYEGFKVKMAYFKRKSPVAKKIIDNLRTLIESKLVEFD